MEQTPKSVTSSAKITEQNTSKDTNSAKINTQLMTSPVPNLVALGLLFLGTLGIIYAGYLHGNMHIEKVFEGLK